MSFGFGNTSFGTPATSAQPFSFGSNTASQAKAPAFGGISLGTPNTTTTTTGFGGFGNLTSTAPSTGFGATTNTGFGSLGTGGFGATSTAPTFNFSTPATTTQSLFSGFGQTQSTTTGFSGFNSKPFGSTTQSSFGGFGTGTSSFGTSSFGQGFGQQTQQQQQQQAVPANPNDILCASVYKCNIFGDERDQIIGHWNLLQALWGTGKGYYAQNGSVCEYTPQNILCQLKTVGYSVKPKTNSSDAIVAISINKKPEDIRNQQLQFESSVNAVLGNKPNVTVHVDRVTPAPGSKSLVLIYVQEKNPNGSTRRIPNSEICNYLLQPMQKQQLVNLGVDNVYTYVAPADEYLENPPAGIAEGIWKQAQLENPDKNKFLPIPIIGFSDLLWRAKCQEEQAKLHEALLDGISEDIANMQRVQVATNVKLSELKQKTLELEHRVLKLIVKVSRTGAEGALPFGPEEERMKSRLESLEVAFNKPSGIKDRLSQIITSLRMHDVSNEKRYECDVDDNMISDLKEFLALEQKAIRELKDVLQADIADMKLMEEEMKKFQLVQAT
ncbi:nuclear pore complex protein Nup54 [Planococcus citri]|uniref:nuclear pore complex protein Nup54 n=1 Tax=Planococcus citri TaxID=170843 RepID=UPI0031F882DE